MPALWTFIIVVELATGIIIDKFVSIVIEVDWIPVESLAKEGRRNMAVTV